MHARERESVMQIGRCLAWPPGPDKPAIVPHFRSPGNVRGRLLIGHRRDSGCLPFHGRVSGRFFGGWPPQDQQRSSLISQSNMNDYLGIDGREFEGMSTTGSSVVPFGTVRGGLVLRATLIRKYLPTSYKAHLKPFQAEWTVPRFIFSCVLGN